MPRVQPGALVLCAHEPGEPAQTGDRQAHRQLCGARVVDAGGIAEGDTRAEVRQHVVDPCGERLHNLERPHALYDVQGLAGPMYSGT